MSSAMHLERWHILEFVLASAQNERFHRAIGSVVADEAWQMGSPILRVDLDQPRVVTRSGREYWLHGPPACHVGRSRLVDTVLADITTYCHTTGEASFSDVSEHYWLRWQRIEEARYDLAFH